MRKGTIASVAAGALLVAGCGSSTVTTSTTTATATTSITVSSTATVTHSAARPKPKPKSKPQPVEQTSSSAAPTPPPAPSGPTVPSNLQNHRLDQVENELDAKGIGFRTVGGGAFGIVLKGDWGVCETQPGAGQAIHGPIKLIVGHFTCGA